MAETTILSPHRDDAVLSCWHRLVEPGELAVVNVFAAPPNGQTDGWWDRLTGATDSRARTRERADEDRAALAIAHREPTDLPFLDDQYRDGPQPLEPIVAAIAAEAPAGTLLLAPAALAGHPDHRLVRDAALALRDHGREVALYADVPHATAYGWPAWVTGVAACTLLDADSYWDYQLRDAGVVLSDLEHEVHRLDEEAQASKAAAVRAYRTQFEALDRPPFGHLSGDVLRYEVTWRL